jgi:GT2 family glycosyltransferase
MYYFVPLSGRSEKRNFAMQHAHGDYFIIFDTDCIIPPHYFETVRKRLTSNYVDCYGGPDNADQSFSDIQKAINFAMTSMMTTGGIRGGTSKPEKFFPRSFNMGLSKQVFETVGGFRNVIGEDIDNSIRIRNEGFKVMLFKDAFVFHKRKLDLKRFLKQVTTFGKARILLSRLHPGSLKLIHLFPACFALGNIGLVLFSLIFLNVWFLFPIGLFVLAIFLESLFKNKKINIAVMSILTSYIQLFGYGFGFLSEWITRKASKATQEELYG